MLIYYLGTRQCRTCNRVAGFLLKVRTVLLLSGPHSTEVLPKILFLVNSWTLFLSMISDPELTIACHVITSGFYRRIHLREARAQQRCGREDGDVSSEILSRPLTLSLSLGEPEGDDRVLLRRPPHRSRRHRVRFQRVHRVRVARSGPGERVPPSLNLSVASCERNESRKGSLPSFLPSFLPSLLSFASCFAVLGISSEWRSFTSIDTKNAVFRGGGYKRRAT